MFVRVKHIKGNDYLYLVENRWDKGKVRQKVRGYLGRIHTFPDTEADFFDYHEVDDIVAYCKKSREEILVDVVKWAIGMHGFTGKNVLKQEGVTVDIPNRTITYRKRPVAIRIQDGYLYSNSLQSLLSFKPGKDKEKSGLELAKMMQSAGIPIPKELFVRLVL